MSSGRISRSEPLKARPIGVRTASMITASGISYSWFFGGGKRRRFPLDNSRGDRLFGRHAEGAIQADGFPVQHRILSDVARKRGDLRRVAEPRRMGDLLTERLAGR